MVKKVLIVLKDVILLSSLKRWYSHSSIKNQLFFAKDGIKALEAMQSESIALLITDLDLPEMDGVELLARMTKDYSQTQITVLFAPELMTVENCKKLKKFSSVYFELKPDSLKDFTSFLSKLETFENKALPAGDIVIADILKLIECQKKNCVLTLENKLTHQKATLYFEEGVLYDAVSANLLEPESIVLEIVAWSQATLNFQPLIQFQTVRKVFLNINELISDNRNNELSPNNELSSNMESKLGVLIEKVLAMADVRTKIKKTKAAETDAQAEDKRKAEAKAEAEKIAKLEAEAQAKSEAEKIAKLEAQAQVEEKRIAKLKADDQSKAEAEKIAKLEAEAQAEAERIAKLKADAQTKAEAERIAKLEAEAQAKAEAERIAKLEAQAQAEAERFAKLEAEKHARAAFVAQLELENTLEPLQKINDYLASAIFDTAGNVFVHHGIDNYKVENLAKNIVALIKIVANSTRDVGLGESSFVQLNCENSLLEAVWEKDSQFIMVTLLDPDSKLANLAKMTLKKAYETMQKKLI